MNDELRDPAQGNSGNDQDWFWRRAQPEHTARLDENTQQLDHTQQLDMGTEPTRQLDLGATQQMPTVDEPTRVVGDTTQGEPTQVFPNGIYRDEPTQQLPGYGTTVMGGGVLGADAAGQGATGSSAAPRHAAPESGDQANPWSAGAQYSSSDYSSNTQYPNGQYPQAPYGGQADPYGQQGSPWAAGAAGAAGAAAGLAGAGAGAAGLAGAASLTGDTSQAPATQTGGGNGNGLPPQGPGYPTGYSAQYGNGGQYGNGQTLGAPGTGWQPQPPKKRRGGLGKGLLAVVAAGLVATVGVLEAPAAIQSARSALEPSSSQSQPAQSGTSGQSGTGTSGTSGTSGQSGTGTSGQSGTGTSGQDPWSQSGSQSGSQSQPGSESGSQSGTPAEQQPYDPWSQQGSSQTQTSTSSQQTNATTSQSKGVVLIDTETTSGEAAGTGMILTSNGYVLTNYHVVQSSASIKVTDETTKKTYTATVVGHDAAQDVALLKISGASNLSTVTIDSDGLSNGDKVTAVGNSEGQGYLSQASGSVTSLASSITVSNEESASGSESLTDVIKTTAGAVPGDSGGPLYDSEGEVVGMTTAGEQSSSGASTQSVTTASYAVPISRALQVVKQIESGKESGTVKVGPNAYLGVSVQIGNQGLTVASVVSGGPAAKAGLTTGSVITSIDGVQVTTQATLSEQLAKHNPGDKVTVVWTDSNGASHTGTVTLGSSPVN